MIQDIMEMIIQRPARTKAHAMKIKKSLKLEKSVIKAA